jgi:hypothetical protein
MTRVTALLCRPAWYLRFSGFAVVFGILIALSCQKKPTEPKPSDPNRTETQLRVTTYALAKGETQEFPAGFEIIASEGIDIAGDLIINRSRPGDFILRAENGNIRISGKVIVQETGNFSSAGKKIIRGLNALKKETAQQGTSLFFTVNRQAGATIDFARWAAIKSGNGMDALGTTIESWDGFFEGEKGGRGGDISITAGRIILPKVQPGDPPLFTLGNGGNGSNITVDRNAFNTKGTTVDIIGGHGGVSGHLYFETDRIEGIPSVDELSPEIEYLAGGVGGRGGNVIWENTEQPILPGSSGTLDFLGDDNKLPSLQEIILRGGWGGSGAIEGGKGGFAAYWSGRVIHFNVPNKKAASVSVTGGNGGEVFGSPVPIYLALGGEGGEYIVLGNYGQPGAAIDVDGVTFPNGADGGNVVGIGGKGGSILEDVIFHSAIGGDGGNSEVAQTRLPNELLVLRRQDPSIFTTAWYGVTAGAGGWGADRDNG